MVRIEPALNGGKLIGVGASLVMLAVPPLDKQSRGSSCSSATRVLFLPASSRREDRLGMITRDSIEIADETWGCLVRDRGMALLREVGTMSVRTRGPAQARSICRRHRD